MKRHNKTLRAVSVTLGVALCAGTLGVFAGCTGKTDALVVMTDALNGLFNPFFSTTGTDMDVVGMTQLSMLSTDENGNVSYGDNEAVVVKDCAYAYDSSSDTTTYNFVLKNGITFSDGVPLTMNDVLFNMYVYLDPAYTGSSTMYSTDIVGLQSYRTQSSSSDNTLDDQLTTSANSRATDRLNELITVFTTVGKKSSASTSYDADEATMKEAINTWAVSIGYKNAIAQDGNISDEDARAQLLKDYEDTLAAFKEELGTDYVSAQDAYTEDPYKATGKFVDANGNVINEVLCFMTYEGFVTINYVLVEGSGYDKNQIKEVVPLYDESKITTKEAAIDHVYSSLIASSLDQILLYWATGTTMLTNYISKAKEVILHEQLGGDELIYKNVSGIVSVGHNTSETSVTVNGTTYKVAQEHNEDGTPKNSDEYDVLRITINGVDPKAIWNFGFTVAPYHYYSDPAKYPVDIENNEFGVEWSSFDFMSGVLQGKNSYGVEKNKMPVGAGPYVATDKSNVDNPDANGFYNDNTVYYKANEDFVMGAPKIKKFRYRYVSSSNALGNLQNGSVHFVEPQFTRENSELITSLAGKGIKSVNTWQLGYGYVGINAGKVPNINIRKAIMAAMDTSLALQYYDTGTAVNIAWPMSIVSWAYPRQAGTSFDSSDPTKNMEQNNGASWTRYPTAGTPEQIEATVKQTIQSYMSAAGVTEGDSSLKITFTIAGSNMTEHPLYNTFIKAMQLLNDCGWEISVVPDTNALVKLSTGSLSVWAAAWGSTVDPDMYQVYHKDSTATSVLAWGYREILAGRYNTYKTEYGIISDMSELIDQARETLDQDTRTTLYKQAMQMVLELAIELPVYQRKTLYAYNAKVIDESTFPETINSYSSPLSRIWELDFVK